ncbi:hypothetical protein OU421_04935 [Methanogenium organophilum]|uniref:Uncharacterized protein n=1 Tax=Methanogenium organophilum TaxID=2199 RepID=A0A9X9S535_METOG|nr:DUF6790 family protein [Methanogenium organophilum]WAI02219.1 hypothetical protein OU421_04935 [Methanogenium organophilum]
MHPPPVPERSHDNRGGESGVGSRIPDILRSHIIRRSRINFPITHSTPSFVMDLVAYLWPLVFPLLGAVIALIHIRVKGHEGVKRLETVLMWQIAIGLGLNMAYSGFGHLVIPD